MAAALAAWAGLAVATAVYLRPAYQAPLTAHAVGPGQHVIPALSYITSSWWTYPGGGRMPASAFSSLINHLSQRGLNAKRPGSSSTTTGGARLSSHRAGSGPSSSSKAAGCSRWPCCSALGRSGWSAGARRDRQGGESSQRSSWRAYRAMEPGSWKVLEKPRAAPSTPAMSATARSRSSRAPMSRNCSRRPVDVDRHEGGAGAVGLVGALLSSWQRLPSSKALTGFFG